MSDKFGRHQSTRWVKASVPSYGDEWNDEENGYDYGSYESEEEPVNTPVVAERFVLPEADSSNASPEKKLVLSIDKIPKEIDELDAESESQASPVAPSNLHDDNGEITTTVVTRSHEPFDLEPPTPVYNPPQVETPLSERSFASQSDADSIQHEPTDLRVGHAKTSSFDHKDTINETPEPVTPVQPEHFEQLEDQETDTENIAEASEKTPQPNLVLSIDQRKFEDSDADSDSDEEPVPYYEKQKNVESDTLDSLINDLQNASFKNEDLPSIDADVSMPDFEGYDFNDDDDEEPATPVAPLSTKDEKEYHEKYINELSSHRPSVRRPPPVPPLSKEPPLDEQPLNSPTYSHFGDAVDAYMSDKDSTSSLEVGNRDDIDFDSDATDKEPDIETKSAESPLDNLAVEDISSELHPVGSTGSLSTGKFSIDPQQKNDLTDFQPPVQPDLSRRDSAMSTNTFSMGGWKPNTNNFRDQFINDNDNESQFHFNIENESSQGYQRFTKPRNVSDNASFISSVSIPETVDVGLPSIHEDEDGDEDLDQDETFSSSNDNSANTSQGLGITKSNMTSDLILNDHAYEDPKFKEELSSKESLGVQQPRYSSLLPPIVDEESSRNVSSGTSGSSMLDSDTVIHKRVSSDVSAMTGSTKRTLRPNAYPVSNWKNIMKPGLANERISNLKDALEKEYAYETGLLSWLSEILTKSDNSSNMHIGRIASQAYQNAAHNDLRRHVSIRSRVSSVKDKVETSGLHASNLGKKFFSRSKKLMRSTNS